MKYTTASFTETGPRPVNEDNLGIWTLPNGGLAVAVADGLGGMGGGDLASRMAIDLFGKAAMQHQSDDLDLVNIAEKIHLKICSTQTSGTRKQTMATTLTAAIIFGPKLKGVHCGDTRAAIARGDGIKRLTKDQTEAQRFFDQGKISKSELAGYPRRNVLDSALGSHKDPTIDEFRFDIQAGDKIFLTTDGVHEKIYLRELRNIAAEFDDPSQFAEKVKYLVQDRTPEDNYSLIAVFIES